MGSEPRGKIQGDGVLRGKGRGMVDVKGKVGVGGQAAQSSVHGWCHAGWRHAWIRVSLIGEHAP